MRVYLGDYKIWWRMRSMRPEILLQFSDQARENFHVILAA
jgi:hypothetical protein